MRFRPCPDSGELIATLDEGCETSEGGDSWSDVCTPSIEVTHSVTGARISRLALEELRQQGNAAEGGYLIESVKMDVLPLAIGVEALILTRSHNEPIQGYGSRAKTVVVVDGDTLTTILRETVEWQGDDSAGQSFALSAAADGSFPGTLTVSWAGPEPSVREYRFVGRAYVPATK